MSTRAAPADSAALRGRDPAPPTTVPPSPDIVVTPRAAAPGAASDPWAHVLTAAAPNRRLRVLLNDCSLVRAEDDVVVLGVSQALLSAVRANEKELCDLLAQAWDRAVKLAARPLEPTAPAAPPEPSPQAAAEVAEHPVVKKAMELFGAKIVRVQPRKDA